MSNATMTVAQFASSVRIGDIKKHYDICVSALAERAGKPADALPRLSERYVYSSKSIPGLFIQIENVIRRYLDPVMLISSRVAEPLTWSKAVELVQAPENYALAGSNDRDFWRLHTKFSAADAVTVVRMIGLMRYSAASLFAPAGLEWVSYQGKIEADAGGTPEGTSNAYYRYSNSSGRTSSGGMTFTDCASYYNFARERARTQVGSQWTDCTDGQPNFSMSSYMSSYTQCTNSLVTHAGAIGINTDSLYISATTCRLLLSVYIPPPICVVDYPGGTTSSAMPMEPLSTGLVTIASGSGFRLDLSRCQMTLPGYANPGPGSSVAQRISASAAIRSGFEAPNFSGGQVTAVYDYQERFNYFNEGYDL